MKRFIFVSSVKAGGERSDVCLDEAMEDNPETPYGRTKLEAERLVFKFARQHKMHAVVLRLPLSLRARPQGQPRAHAGSGCRPALSALA